MSVKESSGHEDFVAVVNRTLGASKLSTRVKLSQIGDVGSEIAQLEPSSPNFLLSDTGFCGRNAAHSRTVAYCQ